MKYDKPTKTLTELKFRAVDGGPFTTSMPMTFQTPCGRFLIDRFVTGYKIVEAASQWHYIAWSGVFGTPLEALEFLMAWHEQENDNETQKTRKTQGFKEQN